MIIVTAGHVDHGKTALLYALTGMQTTHLPEEKKRGLTIDLGYAFLPTPKESMISFIDVPGHERYLTNMLAGIGGVQHALLVVACDDGIMPQTLEHLLLLRLLTLPYVTVVLTKRDKVEEVRAKTVADQVTQLLQQWGWNDSALFFTSIQTGQGIEALRTYLIALQPDITDDNRTFRLSIDRVFSLHGKGVIVTGTALSGHVSVGESLWLSSHASRVRVRELRAQSQSVNTAYATQRVALNLSGDIHHQQIERGDWLLSDPPPAPQERVVALMNTHRLVKQWQPVHIYHAAKRVTGHISLLEQNAALALHNKTLVELIFDSPLYLADNDIVILRDIQAKQTLGSAQVLDLLPPKRGKRKTEYLEFIHHLRTLQSDEAVLAHRLTLGSLSLTDFSWARQCSLKMLTSSSQKSEHWVVGNRLLNATFHDLYQQKLIATLIDFHAEHPNEIGISRARFKRVALPKESDALIFYLIQELLQQHIVKNRQGWLHLANHQISFTTEQTALWENISPLFDNVPLWTRDIARSLNQDEGTIRKLLQKASQMGLLVAIVTDRYYPKTMIDHFAHYIHQHTALDEGITATQFRDHFQIGRRLTIQILEFFDRVGFTVRRKDKHHIRDTSLFQNEEESF